MSIIGFYFALFLFLVCGSVCFNLLCCRFLLLLLCFYVSSVCNIVLPSGVIKDDDVDYDNNNKPCSILLWRAST